MTTEEQTKRSGILSVGPSDQGNVPDRFSVRELRLLPRAPPPNEFFQKGKDFQQHGCDQESGDVDPRQWIRFKNEVVACNVRTQPPKAEKLRPMQNNDNKHGHERHQFEETMDMLFDRGDAPLIAGERGVPQSRQLVQHKADDHGRNNESVNLEKYRRQKGDSYFGQHKDMEKGLLVPARQLNP